MVYVVLALVVLACSFALFDARRRLVLYRRYACVEPRRWYHASTSPGRTEPDDELFLLVSELRTSHDQRQFDSALNYLTLEVQGRFRRAETMWMNWRICAAAGGAGVLLTVWESALVAAFITAVGMGCALLAVRWASRAEAARRAGRERWGAFLDWARVRAR